MTEETNKTMAYMLLAVRCIGECLVDLGMVLAQGIREDNEAKRSGIAAGLRRAASYVEGKPFEVVQDPKHAGNKGTMG